MPGIWPFLSSSAEVKNGWSCNPLPQCLQGVHRDNFTVGTISTAVHSPEPCASTVPLSDLTSHWRHILIDQKREYDDEIPRWGSNSHNAMWCPISDYQICISSQLPLQHTKHTISFSPKLIAFFVLCLLRMRAGNLNGKLLRCQGEMLFCRAGLRKGCTEVCLRSRDGCISHRANRRRGQRIENTHSGALSVMDAKVSVATRRGAWVCIYIYTHTHRGGESFAIFRAWTTNVTTERTLKHGRWSSLRS